MKTTWESNDAVENASGEPGRLVEVLQCWKASHKKQLRLGLADVKVITLSPLRCDEALNATSAVQGATKTLIGR